ncbi:hypothetical protein OUZ56_002081 [Daphnia magna]|uniref:Uncharacterized protein n=1 Tax=Daphnia magna TaxID=35525 RepID=A0ABR0A4M6_9CRUS|nr:hypothetical protein OUZ56_002081 [Daphnia magna]
MDGTTSALAVKMCDPQKKKKATIAMKKRIENRFYKVKPNPTVNYKIPPRTIEIPLWRRQAPECLVLYLTPV